MITILQLNHFFVLKKYEYPFLVKNIYRNNCRLRIRETIFLALIFLFLIVWKSKYFSAKNQWFLVYHIYCIFLFTLKFGLNCINVVFFKFVFCFHNFIIFVVSCVVWNDKNWTKSNHVTALSFYLSETKISAKLTFFNLYYQLAKFYRPSVIL